LQLLRARHVLRGPAEELDLLLEVLDALLQLLLRIEHELPLAAELGDGVEQPGLLDLQLALLCHERREVQRRLAHVALGLDQGKYQA